MTSTHGTSSEQQRSPWSMPDTLVLLFGLAIVLCALTWVIPTGRFDVQEVGGHRRVDLSSFRYEQAAARNARD